MRGRNTILCALLIGTEKIGLDLLGLPGGVTGMREEELSELFSNKYCSYSGDSLGIWNYLLERNKNYVKSSL